MTRFAISMNGNDAVTDALDNFWGVKKQVQLSAPTQAQIQGINPSVGYNQMEEVGGTIKDQVERSIEETRDLNPDLRAAVQYAKPIQQTNAFDIGGFDAIIQKQMAKERGAGSIFTMDQPRSSEKARQQEIDALDRDVTLFKIRGTKEEYAERKKRLRFTAMEAARQARSKARIDAGLAQSYEELSKARRAASGLPVYESLWDAVAGGKRVVNTRNKDGSVTTKIEREGGLFGAVKTTSDQWNTFVTRSERRAAKKAEEQQKLEDEKFTREYNKKRLERTANVPDKDELAYLRYKLDVDKEKHKWETDTKVAEEKVAKQTAAEKPIHVDNIITTPVFSDYSNTEKIDIDTSYAPDIEKMSSDFKSDTKEPESWGSNQGTNEDNNLADSLLNKLSKFIKK
jgi:hypothetical protein